ncbi:RhtB (resistance to homoserine/threonine) family protein [Desulfobotulus alkaliphilus]|uniref:RhtB (Resistance to homoserine/threonine) family protein n=2 Tax=Desulfobotulus alkaliphilus TaxID=622671 RepID=A0A562RQV4_9BACT|nr:RhtB (resistance to homoserine/threonine) family protein [Desulfobotulus alkaliphilus]
MFDTSLLAFLSAMLILTLAPGADTFLVIRNTLKGGQKQGCTTSLGVCSGLFVHASLSAFGISLILMHSATVFSTVKILGALYLIWLGLKSLKSATKPSEKIKDLTFSEGKLQKKSFYKAFQEGFLSNVLNPKTAVFYMAFLPQFIQPDDSVLLKSFFLAGLHFIMALIWLCMVAHGLHRVGHCLRKPAFTRWMEGISGGILVGFGIRLGLVKGLG